MATSIRTYLSDELLARRTGKAAVRAVLRDSRLTGFQCVIGARSKVFRLRLHQGCVTLGRWPMVTAEDARAKALELLRSLAQGQALPVKAQVASLAAPTLADVLADYLDTKRLKASTVRDLRNRLNVHCADWLALPVTAVTPEAFEARYRGIAGASAANAVARYLSALVNFANARHGLELENPGARLRKLDGLRTVRPKDRMVPDTKQAAWSVAVAALADRDAASVLRFLALTGARLNEALRLTWADVNVEAGTVRFRDTKNGTDHVLPPGPHLRALLVARWQAADGHGRPVFDVSESRLRRSVAEVVQAIGLPWSPHDLRRGFVTLAQRTLNDLATVKRLVNHSAGGDVTTRHYLRLSVEDLRAPMARIEAAFLALWGR